MSGLIIATLAYCVCNSLCLISFAKELKRLNKRLYWLETNAILKVPREPMPDRGHSGTDYGEDL